VATQIENECSDAIGVQNLFNFYNTVYIQVFVNDSDQILPLATDIGLSGNQTVSTVPLEIIEGLLYTVLSAGGTVTGVFANLMETATDAALAAPGGTTLNQKLSTQVSALYTSLSTSFQQISTGANTAETSILQDWGRLSQIGPATNVVGYNGLGITGNATNDAETAAIKGYKLAVMAQLMAVAPWSQYPQVANSTTTPDSILFPTPPGSYDQYSYSAFGSLTGSYNSSLLADGTEQGKGNYPDSQVMTTDITDNGGNSFELFNGLNLWTSLPFGEYQNFISCGFVMTLYNATPTDLYVTVSPASKSGYIATPGSGFSATTVGLGGATNPYTFELRPFGYLPINAAGEDNYDINVNVNIFDFSYSETNSVASFNFTVDKSCGHSSNFGVNTINYVDGYELLNFGYHSSSAAANPWGAWVPVQNSSLLPQ
jgi:hypothetical protein